MNPKREKIYVGIIIVLLVFSFYSHYTLSEDLQQTQNLINNNQSRLSNDLTRIVNQVDQIQEEERWWSPGDVAIDEQEGEVKGLTAEWEVRDYREGEKIYLHYRLPDSENYRQQEMTEIRPGIFQASIDLELTIEPVIDVNYSGVNANETEVDQGQSEEAWRIENNMRNRELRHYISTDYDGQRRKSDEKVIHFNGLVHETYETVQIDLNQQGSEPEDFHLNLYLDGDHSRAKYQVSEIEARLQQKGELVEVRELDFEHEDFGRFTNQDLDAEELDFDEILLRFTYDNGEVYERSLKLDVPEE